MVQDERKARVEQYYSEVLNGRNLDAVSEFFADERIVSRPACRSRGAHRGG
jgi:hypothetical protein